jgi:hypothetical protein
MVSVFRFASLGRIIIGAQLHGNPVYLGLAITFALVDFIVPSPWPWSSTIEAERRTSAGAGPRHISAASEHVPHQNTFGRAVPHLTSQASRSTSVLPCPARPTPRTNRIDVTS